MFRYPMKTIQLPAVCMSPKVAGKTEYLTQEGQAVLAICSLEVVFSQAL